MSHMLTSRLVFADQHRRYTRVCGSGNVPSTHGRGVSTVICAPQSSCRNVSKPPR